MASKQSRGSGEASIYDPGAQQGRLEQGTANNPVIGISVYDPTQLLGDDETGIFHVTASPEGIVTAPPGSLAMSETGVLYIKSSGTGNTGWTPVGSAETTQALENNLSRTNDTTPIPLFAFDVPIGQTWAFEAWIDHNSGASGAQWSLGNGDGGAGGSSVHWEVWTWTSGTVRSNVQDVAAFLTTANLGIAPGRRWYMIRGVIRAGTLPVPIVLDVKMPVANTTITTHAGSFIKTQKLFG